MRQQSHDYHYAAAGCPWCGYKMDAATNISGEGAPKPGDISLCLKCASPLQFVEGGLAKIADGEIRHRLSADAYQKFVRAKRLLLKLDRSKVGPKPSGPNLD